MDQHINELNFIDEYLKYIQKINDEETWKQRSSLLRRFKDEMALRKNPSEPVNYRDVVEFLNSRKEYLASTIRQMKVAITLFYEWCSLTLLNDVNSEMGYHETKRFQGITSSSLVKIAHNAGRERLDSIGEINLDDFWGLMKYDDEETRNVCLLMAYFGCRVKEFVSMRETKRVDWLGKRVRVGIKTESSIRTLFFNDRIAVTLKTVLGYDWFKTLKKSSCSQRIRRICEARQPDFQRILTPKSFRDLFYNEMRKSMLDKMIPDKADKDKKAGVIVDVDCALDGRFMGHSKKDTKHHYTNFSIEDLEGLWHKCHYLNEFLHTK